MDLGNLINLNGLCWRKNVSNSAQGTVGKSFTCLLNGFQFEPSPHKTENALLTTAVVVPKAKTEADLRAVGNA